MDATAEDYRTSSLHVAAYLVATGYPLLEIEYSDAQAVFVFPNDDKGLQVDLRSFNMGQAQANATLLLQARLDLVRRVKSRLP